MSLNSIQYLLQSHSQVLADALNLELMSARIEVRILLQATLKVDHAYLIAHAEKILNQAQFERYVELFERRKQGEPIAYLLGEREFFGLNFKVTPATLIPRQDTELLVETALERIPEQGDFKVLDMGVGSGAIAISIAYARSNASVIGVDYSEAAIEVAQINVSHFQLSNLRLILSNWYSELQGHRFDLIVSNPPYIAIDDSHLDQGDLCFEPRSALVSGENGLSDIKYICLSAHEFLHERGWLMLEHGYNQATEVRALLQQQGYSGIFTALDLAGLERVTGGQLLKSVELIDSSIF